jgi:hypothetical protein
MMLILLAGEPQKPLDLLTTPCLYLADLLRDTPVNAPHEFAAASRRVAFHQALSLCQVIDASEHG